MDAGQPITFVDDTDALRALAPRLQSAPRLALDTEFHSERRYRPELMLVQLAGEGLPPVIIDARKVPAAEIAMAIADTPLVVHAGHQDISLVFGTSTSRPGPVRDVQVAAGMCGLDYPARLGDVTASVLDLELDKSVGMADWTRRPLSASQLRYAAADATVLLPLVDALWSRLADAGRAGWADEESAAGVARSLAGPTSTHRWRGWDIAPRLKPLERCVLAALFEWREQAAEGAGQPPHYLLSDGLALDLARRRPRNRAGLLENRRFPGGLAKRHGDALVSVIRSASRDAIDPGAPTEQQRALADLLVCVAQAWGRSQDLAPSLLLPRALADAIAEKGPSAITGWRSEAMGTVVDEFLCGVRSLAVERGRVVLRQPVSDAK